VCCQECACDDALVEATRQRNSLDEDEDDEEDEDEEEYVPTPARYRVSSVALTGEAEDTLEVCLNDDYEDDIAAAHAAMDAADCPDCYPPHTPHSSYRLPPDSPRQKNGYEGKEEDDPPVERNHLHDRTFCTILSMNVSLT